MVRESNAMAPLVCVATDFVGWRLGLAFDDRATAAHNFWHGRLVRGRLLGIPEAQGGVG